MSATTDFAAVGDLDIIVICVPTPVNSPKEPELTALQDAVHTLATYMEGEQLVSCIQSTLAKASHAGQD